MKLLLTSNGITKNIYAQASSLFRKPHERSVLFVTTAAYGEEDNPTWLENYRNELRQIGITNIIDFDIKNKTFKECSEKLQKVNTVFVNGGNTFYLLYWTKKSGFGKAVTEFVNKKGVYIGVSAGSILACPTIETSYWEPGDENKVGISDLKSLGWVKFLISPHFDEGQKEIVERYSSKTQYPVVALTNKQAVLMENEKVKIIGEGEKVYLNGFLERD